MVAYTTRMPAGIPGAVTRVHDATIEPGQVDTTDYPASHGVPLVIDSTSRKWRKVKAGDTAAVIVGFLVRSYPTNSSQDGLGTSTPPASGVIDVMRRGYMTVVNKVGSAVKGGAVYVRVVAASGKAIGDIEATSDGSNNVAIAAAFNGAADADGNVEIAFNL